MEKFDGFEFDRRDFLGKGQFAMVFKGRHFDKPDVPVAVKVIAKKDLGRVKNQLAKEIKILRDLTKIKHENVVGLLKCSETPKDVYLVMEFCNGGELAQYLDMKSTLDEETIQHFIIQIAQALQTMNKMGIVHRDVKPHNILLCHDPRINNPHFKDITVKLADFGFARFLNEGVMTTTMCGSPLYMAPEVIMEQPYDSKADLFSVGAVFFQCLTGKPPFLAQNPHQLKTFYARSQNMTPNVPEWCSTVLCDLLVGLLKRNAEDRISFENFFNHPFLTSPLMPTPSKRILENAPIQNQKIITPQSELLKKVNSPLPATKSAAVRKIGEPRGGVLKGVNPFLNSQRPVEKVPEKMQESTDFTFLPPRAESIRNNHSSSLTTTITSCKPVPVPSQRMTYQKMEEKLAAARKLLEPPVPISQLENAPKEAEPARRNTLRDPSAEDIDRLTLPSPTFVSCKNETRQSPINRRDTSIFPFASSAPTALQLSPPLKPPAIDDDIGEEHKQILAKLRFVAELVDTLMHVAEQKDNPLASAMASRRQLLTTGTSTTNTSSPYRRAEQLVVYVRALHMLSSALLLAQTNVANHVLHLSQAVQQVLNQLNEKYQQCLVRSQELASLGLPSQDPALVVISAERIMYRHAIDLCEAAALDELFGNPHLCSQRYQTAYMMLHTLAEQATCETDKTVLTRYKRAVENRLRILERQGYVTAVM
ncbi:hypothetical protein GCK72_022024 [Caenorhabditis remanei]|uniref:non-specific serine/threonine protein kinase n=1 Tax=Caenorhabditis remanei TaxID=31234 RepID=A0A6A5GLP6_CAERE|nr:hypothetical protein GCK72_022024 [Caenorhabditis remanei]KAF1755455.1 hypothetical protein GCK72_022024 [Caenorhabditis remanei]